MRSTSSSSSLFSSLSSPSSFLYSSMEPGLLFTVSPMSSTLVSSPYVILLMTPICMARAFLVSRSSWYSLVWLSITYSLRASSARLVLRISTILEVITSTFVWSSFFSWRALEALPRSAASLELSSFVASFNLSKAWRARVCSRSFDARDFVMVVCSYPLWLCCSSKSTLAPLQRTWCSTPF